MFLLKISTEDVTRCTLVILVSVFLRVATTLHPYSGEKQPPMYGDYEAQRHWMEITLHLPMNQWYHHNETSNDLNYWGLDYPPLTAYHMYLNGLIANVIDNRYVDLVKSRGYESPEHKLFMRYSVLLSDLLFCIPFVVLYSIVSHIKCERKKLPLSSLMGLLLMYPGLILIDHGHFQYNCVSLGLMVGATLLLQMKHDLSACLLFALAVNYKQMELYHAFPFFLYLLSACIPKPGASALTGLGKFAKLALIVLATFAVLWLPFVFELQDALQVLHRLFPLKRGLFEDKVANVWCTLNIFYKFKQLCTERMVRICTMATLAALLPSSADLFLRPSNAKFVLALINSSLAFYLFGYQVHEKSVLLVAVPVAMHLSNEPLICFWFLHISTFSLLPLMIKDDLVVAYLSLQMFHLVLFLLSYHDSRWSNLKRDFKQLLRTLLTSNDSESAADGVLEIITKQFVLSLVLYATIAASLVGSLLLTFVTLVFAAPIALPDLFAVLISAYCCVHFCLFAVHFNVVQFRIPQRYDCVDSGSCHGDKADKVKAA